MRRYLLFVASATLLAFCAGCGKSTSPAQPESSAPKPSAAAATPAATHPFAIGMVTFAGYAPLYLAKEKGFFGSLDVQLKRIEDVASIRAAVVRGDLDAYLATPDIAQDTNSKPPGKAVWAIDESSGGDGVVVGPTIKSLADLRGKKVAAEPGLPPNFVLMYLLHKNGLSMKDVQYKDMTTQNAATAFTSGAVDAAGIYEPYLSAAKKARSGSRVVISSADTPGLIVDLIFVSDSALANRKEDISTVIAGWEKALDYIRAHHDEAFHLMAASFNLKDADFTDTVAGIKWLDKSANVELFGTPAAPGPLYKSFDEVNAVLKRNRPEVYTAQSNDYLLRTFVEAN